MKKAYSKPEIMFEDFSLSANVAVGCEVKTDNQVQYACGWETRNGVVFISQSTGCTYTAVSGDPGQEHYNTVCYHVPTDTNNLFNS